MRKIKKKLQPKKNQSHNIRCTWFGNVLTFMELQQFHYIREGEGKYTATMHFTNTYIYHIVDPKLAKNLLAQALENHSFKTVRASPMASLKPILDRKHP